MGIAVVACLRVGCTDDGGSTDTLDTSVDDTTVPSDTVDTGTTDSGPGFVAVGGGLDFNCAIQADGVTLCWGDLVRPASLNLP